MTSLRVTLLLAVLVAAGPVATSDIAAQDAERASYIQVMAAYFQVAESEALLLSDEGVGMEHLPVLLMLSRQAGIAPPAILAYRRGGASWIDVGRRFQMNPSRFHVDLEPEVAGPQLERAVRLFRDTPPGQWATLELTDAEVVGLVHVKVLSTYFQVPPARVAEVRASASNWVEVPARLSRL